MLLKFAYRFPVPPRFSVAASLIKKPRVVGEAAGVKFGLRRMLDSTPMVHVARGLLDEKSANPEIGGPPIKSL